MIDAMGTKWLEIDLNILGRNLKGIGRYVSPAAILAVVKADGYGHGAEAVASTAAKAGVRIFGVSCLEEAIALRQSMFKREILIFGALPNSQVLDILNYNLTATICSLSFASALSKEAVRLKRTAKAHICVDTGMGRVGPLHSEAAAFVQRVKRFPGIRIAGLFSHFATSEKAGNPFVRQQIRRFQRLQQELRKEKISIPAFHLANSGAILNFSDSHLDLVRPGLLMYGIYPSPERASFPDVNPVLSFKTRVAFKKTVPAGFTIGYGQSFRTARKTDIITIPVGYADGFSRKFSNRGQVIIRGRKCPVVGAVCMDMIMVDGGRNSRITAGDEVVIIGRQRKSEISVSDIAAALSTHPYEVVCNLGRRVTRVYLKGRRIIEVRRMVTEF